jgi:hypothetical protein
MLRCGNSHLLLEYARLLKEYLQEHSATADSESDMSEYTPEAP